MQNREEDKNFRKRRIKYEKVEVDNNVFSVNIRNVVQSR